MNKMFALMRITAVAWILLATLAGCSDSQQQVTQDNSGNSTTSSNVKTVRILAASENKDAVEIVEQELRQLGCEAEWTFDGSVNIMLAIQDQDPSSSEGYDIVWPADSTWLTLGNEKKVVEGAESISLSPVVPAVRRTVLRKLGWLDQSGYAKQVSMSEFLKAAKDGKFTLAQTNASQSNSGSSWLLSSMKIAANRNGSLELEDLRKPAVRAFVKDLQATVDLKDRSSKNLAERVANDPSLFDAMINYESQIAWVNQQPSMSSDPFVPIYLKNGSAIADYPMGFIDRGSNLRSTFEDLKKRLLSAEVQQRMLTIGRRPATPETDMSQAPDSAFNPAWGMRKDLRIIRQIPPAANVIREALALYQRSLRRPSLQAYVLDQSGSMDQRFGDGNRWTKVVESMNLLLDPNRASKFFLDPTPEDVVILIVFSDSPQIYTIKGDDPNEYRKARAWLSRISPDGSTNLYGAIGSAVKEMRKFPSTGGWTRSIIVLSDGEPTDSNEAIQAVSGAVLSSDLRIDCIGIGEADETVLKELTGSRGEHKALSEDSDPQEVLRLFRDMRANN